MPKKTRSKKVPARFYHKAPTSGPYKLAPGWNLPIITQDGTLYIPPAYLAPQRHIDTLRAVAAALNTTA